MNDVGKRYVAKLNAWLTTITDEIDKVEADFPDLCRQMNISDDELIDIHGRIVDIHGRIVDIRARMVELSNRLKEQ